jgi:glycine cleavage system H protein
MNTPADLKYSKTDEWVKIEGNIATIGISDFAQSQLSDIVYVEFMKDVDDTCAKGASVATIESVKAAAEVASPVSGKILEVNESVSDSPELLNTDPYIGAWLVKLEITDASEVDTLMDSAAYDKYCEERH